MHWSVWSDIVSWRTGRRNNSTKYLLHAPMTITLKRKKWNLLENCHKYALKLFYTAYTWHVLEDLIFCGPWTNLHDQSLNGPKPVTNAWIQQKKTEVSAVVGTQHRRMVELFLRLQQQRFLFTDFFLNDSSSSSWACVRDSVQVAAGGAENTHWNINQRRPCLSGNYRQCLGSLFPDVNGIRTEGSERPDVEAPEKWPCLAACESQRRQPILFSDDTHAVVTRPKWVREHGVDTEWFSMSVGC